jgi:hypothetical protein
VPIIGGGLSTASKNATALPVNATLRINNVVTSSLEHIPVAGKALAVPSKVAGKVLGAIGSLF